MRLQNSTLLFLQKVDRLLSGKMCTVQEATDHQATAYTVRGRDIYIGTSYLAPKTSRDLIRLKGLNFHELAHVLLSPKKKPPIAISIGGLYGVLEDCRIESQLVQKFPSLTDYFIVTAVDIILSKSREAITLGLQAPEEARLENFFLLWGRIYLKKKLRDRVAQMLPYSTETNNKLMALVERFIVLNAEEIMEEGNEILTQIAKLTNWPIVHVHCNSEGGAMLPKSQRGTLADLAKGELTGIQLADSEDEDDDVDEDDDDHDWGDSDSDNEELKAGDLPKKHSDPDADEDDWDEADGDGGGGSSGEGSDEEHESELEKERARLAEEMDIVLESSEGRVYEQVSRELNEIYKESGSSELPSEMCVGEPSKVRPEMIQASVRLQRIFENMSHQQFRGYQGHQKSGSLDLRSLMQSGQTHSTAVFRRFQSYSRKSEPRVALCLDASGSMRGKDTLLASRAAWVILRAFKMNGVAPAMWLFGTHSRQVVYPNTILEASSYMNYFATGSSTLPATALEEAIKFIGTAYDRSILIVITDGSWHDTDRSEAIIRGYKGMSLQIGIGCLYKHGLRYEMEVNSVDSLLERLTTMAVRMQRELLFSN